MVARTIHPFPARMAPDIAIAHITKAGHTVPIVLDPMCGSGTVLSAAAANGLSAHGFDVDPLAVLISSVATRSVNTPEVAEEAARALRTAKKSSIDHPRWGDDETAKFAEYWFAPQQRVQLNRLSNALGNVEHADVKHALQVALSRIIITKTPKASLAADTSHSRPHRVMTASSYSVYEGFQQSVRELIRLLEQRELRGDVRVGLGDARSIRLPDQYINLVITSPPYLNAIDYLRGHRLSLIWLGYSIPELRQIRSNSVGAERALDGEVGPETLAMVEQIKNIVKVPNLLPTSIITRYSNDLQRFAKEVTRVCVVGARIVTVIGNSTLRGNYIRNDLLVQAAYEQIGLRIEDRTERELPENKRYLPVRVADKSSAIAKRMRKEVILVASKY